MSSIDAINQFLQARLKSSKLKYVGAIEAAEWLDTAGILRDSSTRPGKPLRDLLRKGKLIGQRQESNGRWFIDNDTSVSNPSNTTYTQKTQLSSLEVFPEIHEIALPSPKEVLSDIMAERLRVVFVGTAVGNISAQRQNYYSDPRNSFYHELYQARLTPKLLLPKEDKSLINYGIGVTDLVKSTHTSDDRTLDSMLLSAGNYTLRQKLELFKPIWICFNGKTAYKAFMNQETRFGPTGEFIEGCHVFIVPSTSGRVDAAKLFDGRTRSEWFVELAAYLD